MKLNRVILTADALLLIFLVACEDGLFKRKGAIEVQSTPERAEVYLNGEHTGEATNCVLDDIEPGEHSIKLTLSGYWDWESNVTVKAGDTAFVHALFNITEGTLKWKHEAENDYAATEAAPAIGPDGTIYYAYDILYALNPDGSEKWVYWTGRDWDIYCTPVIGSDNTVYIGVLSSESYLHIYALNQNGNCKWEYKCKQYLWPGSPPALGQDGVLYFGVHGPDYERHLYALNTSDGSVKWSCPNAGGYPSIGPDGTIYCSGRLEEKEYLWGISSEGNLLWKTPLDAGIGSISIDEKGIAYFWDGYLKAVAPTGERWRYNTGTLSWGGVEAYPVIGNENIYIARYNGKFMALNKQGLLQWENQIGDHRIHSYYPTFTKGSDGTLYSGCNDGCLYALNTDGSVKWKYYLGEGMVGSPALADDGTLYCATQDGNLYAITSSSRGLASSPWPKYAHDNQNTGRAGP